MTPSAQDAPEAFVASVWSDLLGVAEVDTDVGFFDLGANSVMVARAVVRLRRRWPQATVLDVFVHPTVASLAAHLVATYDEPARHGRDESRRR